MNVSKVHAAIATRLGHIQYTLLQQLTTPGEPMVNGCKSFSILRSRPDNAAGFANIIEVVTERPAGKRWVNYEVSSSQDHSPYTARYYPNGVIVVVKTEVQHGQSETRRLVVSMEPAIAALLQLFEDFLLRGDLETHRALAALFEVRPIGELAADSSEPPPDVKTAEGTKVTGIHEDIAARQPTPHAQMEAVLRKVLNQILQESPQDSEAKAEVSIRKLSGEPAPYALIVKHDRVQYSVIATLVSEDEHSYLCRHRFLVTHFDSPGAEEVDVECEYRFALDDRLRRLGQEAGLTRELRGFLLEHKLPQRTKPTTP